MLGRQVCSFSLSAELAERLTSFIAKLDGDEELRARVLKPSGKPGAGPDKRDLTSADYSALQDATQTRLVGDELIMHAMKSGHAKLVGSIFKRNSAQIRAMQRVTTSSVISVCISKYLDEFEAQGAESRELHIEQPPPAAWELRTPQFITDPVRRAFVLESTKKDTPKNASVKPAGRKSRNARKVA